MAIRTLILCLALGRALGDFKSQDVFDQQMEGSDPQPQVVRPLTFGSVVLSEVQRLQSLQDVHLPQNLSHYTPYGERSIVAMQFPSVSAEVLAQATKSGYGLPLSESQYGPPPNNEYGPPKPKYGPPKEKSALKSDLGVIVSQNYIYREHHRDFENVFKQKQGRPSSELVIELAKAFGQKNGRSSNPISPYSGGIYQGHGAKSQPQATQDPSYVIVAIESRLKTNPNSGQFGFVEGTSLTNGTIIFPSPKDSTVLTNLPFILRNMQDIDHVFNGYETDSERLIPKEKTEIINFLKLVYELHEDVHDDGKETISRLRRLGDDLQRPRIREPEGFPDDTEELKEKERNARLSNWLYTSTVGLRTLTQSSASGIYKIPTDGASKNENFEHGTNSNTYETSRNRNNAVESYQAPPPLHSNAGSYQTLVSNSNFDIVKAVK